MAMKLHLTLNGILVLPQLFLPDIELAFLSLRISHIFQLQIASLKKVHFPETDKN